MASGLVFMGFLNMWTSGSLFLVCSLVLLISFVLSNCDVLAFFLPYYIIFYYYPFETCFFTIERQKGWEYRWEERWGETGRHRNRGNHNKDILHEEKIVFSILKKESDAFYIDVKCSIQMSKWRQDEIQM